MSKLTVMLSIIGTLATISLLSAGSSGNDGEVVLTGVPDTSAQKLEETQMIDYSTVFPVEHGAARVTGDGGSASQ